MTSKKFVWLGGFAGCTAVFALVAACSSSSSNKSGNSSQDAGNGDATSSTDAQGSADAGNSGDGGTGVDGSSGTSDNLGASCATDTDCGGGGLTCALPTSSNTVFGGGPANGYCTKSCASDTDCGASGMCLTGSSGTSGTCVLTCTQGPALSSINDPISDQTKCLARTDVACAQVSSSAFACVPACGSDSQCPSGLHCDPQANVCVATPHAGLATGKACDPSAATPQCAGTCLTLDTGDGGTTSMCSEGCELGVDPNASTPTAWTDCGGVKNGLCAYLASGEGAGDLGYCTNACSKQDDCDNPNFFCYAITNLTGAGGITNGWCLGATPCPNGNSDCTANGFPGSTCVQTAYGPQCLSSQFPLGSAAPADAGTSADAGSSDDAGGSDASSD